MEVIVQFEIADDDEPDCELWKLVVMPCLPLVGSILFPEVNEGCVVLTAVEVHWYEEWPSIMHIYCESTDVEYGEISELKRQGWQDVEVCSPCRWLRERTPQDGANRVQP